MNTFAVQVGTALEPLEGFERVLGLFADDVAQLFPNQIAAIELLATELQSQWQERAARVSSDYADAVFKERIGDLEWRVFLDPASKKAYALEQGRPAWDLKQALRTSPKARQGRNGRYLVIPFRHGNPQAVTLTPMPRSVYQLARKLPKSRAWGGVSPSRYEWGGKLSKADLEATGHDEAAAARYAGMVRMEEGRSAAYVTFRTLSEVSPTDSWIIPDRPGYHFAEAVVEWANREAETLLQMAREDDLALLREVLR